MKGEGLLLGELNFIQIMVALLNVTGPWFYIIDVTSQKLIATPVWSIVGSLPEQHS